MMDLTSEKDLLKVAHKVLVGKLRRHQLLELPPDQLAYAAITMMLALRYKLNERNQATQGLTISLKELVLSGKAICQFKEEVITGMDLYDVVIRLELCDPEAQAGDRLTSLTPPPELVELVSRYHSHPAVTVFQKDMARGIEIHLDWLERQLEESSRWSAGKALNRAVPAG